MNKILLAHLKKPPFETRIFDKIGKSLGDSGLYEVSILGNSIPADFPVNLTENIRLHPIFQSRAHSPQVAADLSRFQDFLYSELPDVVVICSPELLVHAIIYSVIKKKQLVLDLQENFPLNYFYQSVYHWPWNKILNVVSKAYLSALVPRVDRIWLAERIYSEQMNIPDYTVIENKVPSFWKTDFTSPVFHPSEYVLFTGYLSEESGVLSAIEFFSEFQMADPDLQLIIAGYCPSENLKVKIKNRANANPGIHLFGLDYWVPSETILSFLSSALAVLMPYNETNANAGKIPTKLFEAASLQVPVIVPLNSQFLLAASELSVPAIEVSFLSPKSNDFKRIKSEIRSIQKEKTPIHASYLFDSEKIAGEIENLISRS